MIAHMRASGLPKPVGMRLLADVKGIPLGEAKKLVHFSPVWADRKASDEAFHEGLYKSAEELKLLEPQETLLRSGTHG